MNRSDTHYLVAQLGWMFCLFTLFHEPTGHERRTRFWNFLTQELPGGWGAAELWVCVIWLAGALLIGFMASLLSGGEQKGTKQVTNAESVRAAAKRRL